METPASLVHRAALSRRQGTLPPPAQTPPPRQAVQAPAPVSRQKSGHASYTALMRSHDRVSTRHIPPHGGA